MPRCIADRCLEATRIEVGAAAVSRCSHIVAVGRIGTDTGDAKQVGKSVDLRIVRVIEVGEHRIESIGQWSILV
jgi:hypothetical protein